MPIDPRIALSGQPVQLRSPLESIMAVESLRMQQANAAALGEQRSALADQRRMVADKAAREAAEEQALRQRLAQGQPMSLEEMASIVGPERAAKIDEGFMAVQSRRTGALASGLGAVDALPAGLRQDAYAQVRQQAIANGWAKDRDLPEQYTPEVVTRFTRAAMSPEKQAELTKPIEVSAGATLATPTGQALFTAPSAPKAKQLQSKEMLVGGKPTVVNFDPDKGQYFAPGGAQPLADVRPIPPRSESSPSKFWVMRGGRPLRITEDEYQPGDTPASTREQGRPVTSGDAGRVAELDTSLDDLKVLRTTLGSTGAASAIGAWVPNVVTEMTGWGSDAKQRQGTIDRVKQVIGKALEGGVLRKEDEYKYTKILPTISDPPEVAKSKLDDLEKALIQRRSVFLSALEDSGYDTAKFNARDGSALSAPPPAAGPKPAAAAQYSVQAPNGKTYTFRTKGELDAFKRQAGIK